MYIMQLVPTPASRGYVKIKLHKIAVAVRFEVGLQFAATVGMRAFLASVACDSLSSKARTATSGKSDRTADTTSYKYHSAASPLKSKFWLGSTVAARQVQG